MELTNVNVPNLPNFRHYSLLSSGEILWHDDILLWATDKREPYHCACYLLISKTTFERHLS